MGLCSELETLPSLNTGWHKKTAGLRMHTEVLEATVKIRQQGVSFFFFQMLGPRQGKQELYVLLLG